METKQKIFVTIGTAAVVAAAIFGGATLFNSTNTKASTTTNTVSSSTAAAETAATTPASTATAATTPATSTATPTATTNTSATTSTTASGYKDGTYTKTISYSVPHGATNSIKVTLVISGGKITSATTNNTYSDREQVITSVHLKARLAVMPVDSL